MIYTILVSLITSVVMMFNSEVNFFTGICVLVYYIPFAISGGVIAHMIKVIFVQDNQVLATPLGMITYIIFWNFIAQVIGSIFGVTLATMIPYTILKFIAWILAIGLPLVIVTSLSKNN